MFKCLKCGHAFHAIKTANNAALYGCPRCGSRDIDRHVDATAEKCRPRLPGAPAYTINHPSDITNLGWVGNYAGDERRFAAVDAYVRDPARTPAEQKEALYLMTLHGMGIDEPISDEDLRQYLES
jgi:predicted  nucleic acid-binding Zn-ribbon protein